jgi:hypothetical protein
MPASTARRAYPGRICPKKGDSSSGLRAWRGHTVQDQECQQLVAPWLQHSLIAE